MKQKHPNDCVPTVMAMITGCKPKEFKDWIKKHYGKNNDKGYTDIDVVRFLVHKNYGIGVGFQFYGLQHKINKKDRMEVKFPLTSCEAYVTVQSEHNKEWSHAVYWNGEKIYDPNPDVKDGRPLRCYNITSWTPVYKFNDNAEHQFIKQFWVFND